VLTSANGAGVSGTGLYWSTDRVDSWLDITEELTDTVVVDLVADPAPGGGLYVVTSNGLFRWIWTGHTAPPIIPQAPTTAGQGRVTGSAR
jgi:hypothetical protein